MSNTPSNPGSDDFASQGDEVKGVFKSSDIAVHRLNPGTNSAVSDVAISREIEELPANRGIAVDAQKIDSPPGTPAAEEDSSATAITQTIESIQASMAKVDAMVQSVEQRQTQIDEAQQKAEAMLLEVSRITEALSFNDALRDRIEATVARTRRLRSGLEK